MDKIDWSLINEVSYDEDVYSEYEEFSDTFQPTASPCHLTGTRMRHTQRMLWIGAIFGALFGWIGILVAALFWATLAIIKLIWALTLFAFQALLWVGAFIYKGIEYLVNRQSTTTKAVPPALLPKRTRKRKQLKRKESARE
jgi:hypothetical protein